VEIIIDGEVDNDKLRSTGHDMEWLLEQVKRLGGESIEDVTYLAVNAEGEVIGDIHRKGTGDIPPV
jgi:uncharacterized membrane protein YcaP (DUF421 family)